MRNKNNSKSTTKVHTNRPIVLVRSLSVLIVIVWVGYLTYLLGWRNAIRHTENGIKVNLSTSTITSIEDDKLLSAYDQKIFDLVNEYRNTQNLKPLTVSIELCKSATAKLTDMITKDYFEHDTPEGGKFYDFIKPYLRYSSAGENLAASNEGAEKVVRGWIDSPTHRANLLGQYNWSCVKSDLVGRYSIYDDVIFSVEHFASIQ